MNFLIVQYYKIVRQYVDHVQTVVVVNNKRDSFDPVYKIYLIHARTVNEAL